MRGLKTEQVQYGSMMINDDPLEKITRLEGCEVVRFPSTCTCTCTYLALTKFDQGRGAKVFTGKKLARLRRVKKWVTHGWSPF